MVDAVDSAVCVAGDGAAEVAPFSTDGVELASCVGGIVIVIGGVVVALFDVSDDVGVDVAEESGAADPDSGPEDVFPVEGGG